jgi:hypothetical protein
VIVAAAICPCPPLLARELTGQAEVLPELRAACAAAVGSLAAAGPDVIVVAGPDEETASWDPGGRLDTAAYAPAGALGPRAGRTAAGLPLSLGIGARLLDEAGYTGPRALHGIAALAVPDDCLRLGHQVARSAPRVALLAMGDGSARRSVSAPGYLDERAAPFDAAVERAVRDADLAALAALDPDLAADLMAAGRPAWQVLAGALGAANAGDDPAAADGPPPGRLRSKILYCDAPFGVAYLVAALALPARQPRLLAGSSRSMTVSWILEEISSLPKMWSTCASTVRLEMNSRAPISRLDSPLATSTAISRSRLVSRAVMPSASSAAASPSAAPSPPDPAGSRLASSRASLTTASRPSAAPRK